MPRPKTKGEPIQIRLPLHADQTLRQLAATKGKTIVDYVTDYLTRAATAAAGPNPKDPT